MTKQPVVAGKSSSEADFSLYKFDTSKYVRVESSVRREAASGNLIATKRSPDAAKIRNLR